MTRYPPRDQPANAAFFALSRSPAPTPYDARASVLWSVSRDHLARKLNKFMAAAAETSTLESRVGHYYQLDGIYRVASEKVREYARAVQDYHPAHWDVAAAAKLGYSGLVAPLTFTSIPGMVANRHLFESVVVGYDMYLQTEEVFEQHRPIVAGDELHTDVELSSVRRIAGRDLITVTNTFTDSAGERVHTMHTTVVGVTAEDVDPAMLKAAENVVMHDVNLTGIDTSEAAYRKTVRPAGEVRIAQGGADRIPGTPSFDDLKVGDELPVHHARLSRGDLVNYAGVAGDANPLHWDENVAKLARQPDVIAHGMLTMGLGAGFASAWSGDPGAVTRYAVRLSQPAIVSATGGADIEYSGRIKSLDPATRSGVIIVAAKSNGRKIFGLATLNVRFS
ncbi:fused (3R)-hydroxyacyl-ACP dehydratase subunits HadA/HadB [Mycobacterium senriense]